MNCEIELNDERLSLPAGTTLGALLKQRQVSANQVLVEHNGEALTPAEVPGLVLAHGDRLQLVRMMAGG